MFFLNNGIIINFGTFSQSNNATDKSNIVFVFPCSFVRVNFVVGQAWRNNNEAGLRDVTSNIYAKSLTQVVCGWYRSYSQNAYATSFSYIAIGS